MSRSKCYYCGHERTWEVCARCHALQVETNATRRRRHRVELARRRKRYAERKRQQQASELVAILCWFRGHVHRSDADRRLGFCWISSDAESWIARTDLALAKAKRGK